MNSLSITNGTIVHTLSNIDEPICFPPLKKDKNVGESSTGYYETYKTKWRIRYYFDKKEMRKTPLLETQLSSETINIKWLWSVTRSKTSPFSQILCQGSSQIITSHCLIFFSVPFGFLTWRYRQRNFWPPPTSSPIVFFFFFLDGKLDYKIPTPFRRSNWFYLHRHLSPTRNFCFRVSQTRILPKDPGSGPSPFILVFRHFYHLNPPRVYEGLTSPFSQIRLTSRSPFLRLFRFRLFPLLPVSLPRL